MKIHRNKWTAVGLACLLAVSAVPAPCTEWTGMTVYAADAISGSCGDHLNWKLENGTLTISGTGAMNNYGFDNMPWRSSRGSIKTVYIEDGVTRIGDSAFRACSNLNSITIPDSVTSIGYAAFYGCSKLSSITIPDSVTSIGAQAFNRCSNLSSITIPNKVTSIGDYTFCFCSNLGSITIPDSVTSIGSYAFNGCSNLSSITIPDSVTSIGDSAFMDCNSLTSVIYHVTETQWDKISNSFPKGINVIYAEHIWNDGKCTVCDHVCEHTDSNRESMLVKTEENTPTCTKAGNIEYWTCSECGLKFADEAGTNKLDDGGEVSPALNHHYPENPVQTDWKKYGSYHWLECDRDNCSDQKSSIKDEAAHTYVGDTCSVCGYERAHDHYGFIRAYAKEATCTEAGHDVYYTCSGCNALFKDGIGAFPVSLADLTIPATGHKYDSYLQDTEGHWQQCSVCGEATAKESHHYNGNICVTCGYQKPEANTNTETKTETNTSTTRSSGGSHHDSADVTDNSQKGRWVQDEKGWYFRRDDGSYPKSGWMKLKWLGKEYWYYFDENGYMKLGWLDVNGSRYYLNPVIGTNSGKMLTGWQQIDQKWYYFSTETGAKEGSLLRNTVTPDNYRVDENGIWQQ